MMDFVKAVVTHISPIFIVTSPITSYADQIYSIHRNRSSAGFSLDIPLIMLVASITKIFYWFGVRYDTSLLIQASLMIFMQVALLHTALTNRPSSDSSKELSTPFAPARANRRPYDFWQWRSIRPYWLFIGYFTVSLAFVHLILGRSTLYVNVIGYAALAVEAMLPVPQVLTNQRNRSVRGFRLSVIVNWLIGDVMKMTFFFLSETTIPWAFKLCGLFQWACDIYLAIQYFQFGEGAMGS